MDGLRWMLDHRQKILPGGVLDTLVPIMPTQKIEPMINISGDDVDALRGSISAKYDLHVERWRARP